MDRDVELGLHHTHRDITLRCGSTHRATLPALLLRTYLPAYPSHLNRRHQLDLAATYIPASPLTTHNLLRASKITAACAALIAALDASTPSTADALLADLLARAQLEDRRAHASGAGVRHPRTLTTFLVLADLSRAFRSRKLGGVCVAFFARHGQRVLGDGGGDDEEAEEHPQAVVLWAWALGVVVRAGEAEREACVREVVAARPDVLGVGSRYERFVRRGLPGGDALWEVVERVGERERMGPGGGWRRRVLDDGGVEYLHEHRERRLVRAGRAGKPLGLETYHRSHRHVDPDEMLAWKPEMRGYGGIGGSGLRGALGSIKDDQRELRHDVHDLRDELDELAERVEKMGRHDRDRRPRDRLNWRERDIVDLPDEYEESVSEWWDDYY